MGGVSGLVGIISETKIRNLFGNVMRCSYADMIGDEGILRYMFRKAKMPPFDITVMECLST